MKKFNIVDYLDPAIVRTRYTDKENEEEDKQLISKINSHETYKKYSMYFSLSIIFLLLSVFLLHASIVKNYKPPQNPVYSANLAKNQMQQLVPMPYPHQSFSGISNWLKEAVSKTYSFDFSNYDKKVNDAAYYFTPEGYAAYNAALEGAKMRDTVIGENLEVSTIPIGDPIWVNGGRLNDGSEWWRYRFDVLTSYYGGAELSTKSNIIEVLVFRVPTHINPKGLAINQFSIKSN